MSGTETERLFLTHRAREKGIVFTSIWNDYEEACVLEPSVNTFPLPVSRINDLLASGLHPSKSVSNDRANRTSTTRPAPGSSPTC